MSSPFPASPASAMADEVASLRGVWWLLALLGLVSIIVGFLAISATFVATLASVVYIGVLLVIAGVTEVIHAFMVRSWKGFGLHAVAAALYLMVGVFMLEHPERAAAVLTLLLAASFFVGGVLRILFAVSLRFHSWPWVVLNGVVDLLLGALIWSEWPESSLWVIGLFVGIDLLLHGWSWLFLALNLRTVTAPTA